MPRTIVETRSLPSGYASGLLRRKLPVARERNIEPFFLGIRGINTKSLYVVFLVG